MTIRKTIVPIAVVMLFLVIALSPGLNAEGPATKKKKLTVLMRGVTDGDYSLQMDVSEDQLEELTVAMDDFLQVINSTKDKESAEGKNISDSEWVNIKTSVNSFVDLLKTVAGDDFPDEDTKIFVSRIIDLLIKPLYLIRQPLISVGIGITWLPFYDYETFFGKMIRPVVMQHFLGFSATLKFNPFVVGFTCVRYNLHRVRTFLFDGLMINFGDLGVNRFIGPQLLIGFGCFTGFA